MDRRAFLQSCAAAALLPRLQSPPPPGPRRKAVLISMLPQALPYAERFAIARDAGLVRRAFDEVGYRGYFTTEVAAGDAAYLKDLAVCVDRFLSGRTPA